jgi:glycosyltransferase involved in cell wall biosynthesis
MISIVAPTLNKRECLPGLIQNCLSHHATELILVDGGSKDGTQDYLKRINNNRVSLIQAKEGATWPALMNLGIQQAKNEIICQWNAEALMLTHWDTIIRTINNNFDIYVFAWKAGSLRDVKDLGWLDAGQFKDGTSINGWICSPSLNYGIYRKRVFRAAGLFCEEFNSRYADADMTRRALVFGFTNRIKLATHIQVADLGTSKTADVPFKDQALFDELGKLYPTGKLPDQIKKLER